MEKEEAFWEGYWNQTIALNSDSIKRNSKYFKESCNELGIEFSLYGHLPQIEEVEHLEPWKKVGKSLIEKVESQEIPLNNNSRNMILNYMEIAETLKNIPLMETALQLSKKMIEKYDKQNKINPSA